MVRFLRKVVSRTLRTQSVLIREGGGGGGSSVTSLLGELISQTDRKTGVVQ